MELRQLKYFVEVAHKEHVTKAAHKLHIAQSAISRQIANLEAELGVDLFVREGRRVKLTPVGNIFLQRVEKAIDQLERGLEEISEFLDPELGEIRLGFLHSLSNQTVPTIISNFRKKHNTIGFKLKQGIAKELIRDIINGEIDIAFVSPVPIDHPEVQGHVLFTEEIKAILPKHHPLAGNTSIRLSQLAKEDFVLFGSGFTLRKIALDACQQAGFKPKIAFEGGETSTIRGLVAAGLGVGLLPEISLIEGGGLEPAVVRISEPRVTRTVGFVTSRTHKLTPSERIFQHFLWEFFRQNK